MTVQKQKPEPSEAAKMVERLMKRGMRPEEIATRLRVSLNSVIRWRRGVNPQPGHMASLRDLIAAEKKRKVVA